MIGMTGIEEIVKYQQELLNHQRNQKQIQKETLKLLNSLNKNIMLMSDRLDEFASKTNIKLEPAATLAAATVVVAPTTIATNTAAPAAIVVNGNQLNGNMIAELNGASANDLYFSNYYDPQFGTATNSLPTTSAITSEDIKEYYILSDCNLEPLSMPHHQPLIVIQQDSLLPDNKNAQTLGKTSPNTETANRSRVAKLLDVRF